MRSLFTIMLAVLISTNTLIAEEEVVRNFESKEELRRHHEEIIESGKMLILEKSIEECAGSICTIVELDERIYMVNFYNKNETMYPLIKVIMSIAEAYMWFTYDDKSSIDVFLVSDQEYAIRQSNISYKYDPESGEMVKIEPPKM